MGVDTIVWRIGALCGVGRERRVVVSRQTAGRYRRHVDKGRPEKRSGYCCQWKQVGRNGDDKHSDFMWTKERRRNSFLRRVRSRQLETQRGLERERVRGSDARPTQSASSTCLTVITRARARASTSYQLRKLDLACHLDQLISRTRLSPDVCRLLSRPRLCARPIHLFIGSRAFYPTL